MIFIIFFFLFLYITIVCAGIGLVEDNYLYLIPCLVFMTLGMASAFVWFSETSVTYTCPDGSAPIYLYHSGYYCGPLIPATEK